MPSTSPASEGDASELPPPGQLVADHAGEKVQCHACGRWYPMLGVHAARAHGMNGAEYREAFGLNRGTKLASPALRSKLSELFGERITNAQLPVNPLLNAPAERIAMGRQRSKRLQFRSRVGELQREYQAEHPQPKATRPRPPADRPRGLIAGPQRLAELHKDPVWRANWLLRVRMASRLTDAQIVFVREQAGRETQRALADRLGVTVNVIRKVWRGELRPLSELLAEVAR